MKISIEKNIYESLIKGLNDLYGFSAPENIIQIQKTRPDFEGDFTLVVFPFLKHSKKSPEQTAEEIGWFLKDEITEIEKFNVIKGFLNLSLSLDYWLDFLKEVVNDDEYGIKQENPGARKMMIEYSSPNTNKPLHLGHIRNNLLGYAVSNILKANGHEIKKVNLVNDRGIHICKSMLAWQKWGEGKTPQSVKQKGDQFVGDYYVKFDQEYKKQVESMKDQGMDKERASKEAPLIREAQEMLHKWEQGDESVNDLWKRMNNWVLQGFDNTYKRLGVDFDEIDYESQTYQLGKEIVLSGLQQGIFFRKEDGSVWIDLKNEGLDEKLLLRADGTSVYITQDIGTAIMRYRKFPFKDLIYVVGNEQEYHFKVLAIILGKLGYDWSKHLYHLSYGMVELPSGKMKSREGTVVDADDLIDEMVDNAKDMSQQLGKLDEYTKEQKEEIFRIIGLGALKYFILKVDPKKNMLFDPQESIDFNGNTGPFIQYTYARILSVFRKAKEKGIQFEFSFGNNLDLSDKEQNLIKKIYQYPGVVSEAGEELNPSLVANYTYDLVKQYNQFYQDHPILKEENKDLLYFRLTLSRMVSNLIYSSMGLLGIEVPERM